MLSFIYSEFSIFVLSLLLLSELAGRMATLEVELSKSEASREAEVKKAVAYKEKYKKTLALLTDLEAYGEGMRDFTAVSRNIKDRMLEHLLTVRTEDVRDYLNSDAHMFHLDTRYDVARQDGFDAVVGQLQKKGPIPKDYNLEDERVSAFNAPDVSAFVSKDVEDDVQFQSEFVELVCEENDENRYNHGGPYLPSFVPEVMMSHNFMPFKEYLDHHREWLKIPGPVLGRDRNLDLYEECPKFIQRKKEERAKSLSEHQASQHDDLESVPDRAQPESQAYSSGSRSR